MSLGHRLGQLLKSRKRSLAVLLGWAAVSAILTGSYGILVGPLVRALFGGGSFEWPSLLADHLPPAPSVDRLRIALPWILVACAFAKGVATYRYATSQARFMQSGIRFMRESIHERLMQLNPGLLARFGSSYVSHCLMKDVDAMGNVLRNGILAAVRDLLHVMCLVVICFVIDWQMALVVFLVYPLAVFPIAHLGKRLRRAASSEHEEHAQLAALGDDHFRRLPLYQITDTAEHAQKEYQRAGIKFEDAVVESRRIRALSAPVTETLGAVALAGGIILTMNRLADTDLAPEYVMSFLACILLLYQPVKTLIRVHSIWQPGLAAHERIESLFSVPRKQNECEGHVPPTSIESIRIRELSYAYSNAPVFEGLSFHLRKGQLHLLRGPNGSGKSTLILILAGLLHEWEGTIDVNLNDLRRLDVALWRRRVAWVGQNDHLGWGTIRSNVLLGREELAPQLEAAAEQSGLQALLDQHGMSWDTDLGDHGHGLSGGERQKVALCRALLSNPDVILLDEPESHLDEASIREFALRLDTLKQDRIILVASHGTGFEGVADVIFGMSTQYKSFESIRPSVVVG